MASLQHAINTDNLQKMAAAAVCRSPLSPPLFILLVLFAFVTLIIILLF